MVRSSSIVRCRIDSREENEVRPSADRHPGEQFTTDANRLVAMEGGQSKAIWGIDGSHLAEL